MAFRSPPQLQLFWGQNLPDQRPTSRRAEPVSDPRR